MLLMKGQQIKKSYGEREIISLDQFSIYDQDRIGIVGLNGSGKSTLLKLFASEIVPDEGVIESYTTIAYIPQLEDIYHIAADHFPVGNFLNSKEDLQTTLSGGERTRLKIDQALNTRAPLLLADEPTSHLDLDGIVKLEETLISYKGAVVLISHDKTLLNHVCNKIIEVEDGNVAFYKGNYDDYESTKERIRANQLFEYETYLKDKERLMQAAVEKKEKSEQMKKAPSRMGNSEARLHKGSTRQKKGKVSEQSKRLLKRLAMLEEKEKPKEDVHVAFDLKYFYTLHAKYAVQAKELSFSFGKKKIFNDLSFTVPTGASCAIIGGNGAGKTTLAKLINSKPIENLTISEKAKIGYYTQDLSQLDGSKTILEEIKENSRYPEAFIRTICARLLFAGDAVLKKIGDLSGGERAKVALAKIFLGDYNVLLLDEPTNYLDIHTKNELTAILKAYPGTIIFISHDRDFIQSLADQLLIFHKTKAIESFCGSYLEWDQKQQGPGSNDLNHDSLILEMELTSVLSQLSTAEDPQEKQKLEKRFNELLQLKKTR